MRRVEGSPECVGHFDEIGDFIEETRIVGHVSADLGRELSDLFADAGFTGIAVNLNVQVGEGRGERGCVVDSHFRSAIGTEPACGPSALDLRIREGNDIFAKQGHDPADGPGKGNAV